MVRHSLKDPNTKTTIGRFDGTHHVWSLAAKAKGTNRGRVLSLLIADKLREALRKEPSQVRSIELH